MATITRYVDPDADPSGNGTTAALTGANCAFQSLSVCESTAQAAHTSGDITSATGDDSIEVWVCGSAHASHTADTTAVDISGWVTSAANYISIQTDSTNRAGTSWNTSKYRLQSNSASVVLSIGENYVRVDGLQIWGSTTSTLFVVRTELADAANDLRLSNLLIRGAASSGAGQRAVYINDNDSIVQMWNCILYDIGANASSYGMVINSATMEIRNCTVVVAAPVGLERGNGTITVKNTYVAAATTCFSGTYTQTTNASSDTTATGTGLDSIAANTSTFVNVTAGSENYALAAASPLIGVGTDTSGDGTTAGAGAATDILGTARGAAYDVGAHEYVAGGVKIPVLLTRASALGIGLR